MLGTSPDRAGSQPVQRAPGAAVVIAGFSLLALACSACGTLLGIDGLTADLDGGSSGEPSGSSGGCVSTCGSSDCGSCPSSPRVDVGSFSIDVYEVTNDDYHAWLAIHPSTAGQPLECAWNDSFVPGQTSQEAVDFANDAGAAPETFCHDPGVLDQSLAMGWGRAPVACVDWCDAVAYCAWTGGHLCGKIGGGTLDVTADDGGPYDDPNESEWFAACSNGGTQDYPYAGMYDPERCNDDNSRPKDVGSYETCAGALGIYDMSGNVTEWEAACTDYGNPPIDQNCLIRGGAYYTTDPLDLACANLRPIRRYSSSDTTGFRCCAD